MRKTIVAVGAMIGLTVAVIALGVHSVQSMTPDAPPYDDSALRPKPVGPLPDDAFTDFKRIAANLELNEEEWSSVQRQFRSPAPDPAALTALLARNERALSAFADFAKCSGFTDPTFREPGRFNADTPERRYFPLVAAADLTSLRAAKAMKNGRTLEALKDALLILDAGQVLLRSEQPLAATRAGFRLMEVGVWRLYAVLNAGDVDETVSAETARHLAAYRGSAAALQAGLRYEYLFASYSLDHMAEFAKAEKEGRWYYTLLAHSLYVFQRERTRAMLASRFEPLIEAAAAPCLKVHLPKAEPLAEDARPNVLGRMIYNMTLNPYEDVLTLRCQTDAWLAKAATEAAISTYYKDRGRLPASLRDLVPDYLATVPVDPYTGDALIYRADGTIHSAGKSLEGQEL